MVKGASLFSEGAQGASQISQPHCVILGVAVMGNGVPVHKVTERAQKRHEFLASHQTESFSAELLVAPWPVGTDLTSHYQMVSTTLNGRRTQGAD